MINLNTNLSSLIVQQSLKESTLSLNQTIERLSTGFKINHASDNAANYSIATDMTTKIGSFQVAEDNAAMSLDMLSTTEGVLLQIEDKLSRMRALAVQANNNTYGEQSLEAINAEASALAAEINRLYETASFNGIKLLSSDESEAVSPSLASLAAMQPLALNATPLLATTPVEFKPEYGKFLVNPETYTDEQVADMQKLSEVSSGTTLDGQYSISTKADLEKLQKAAEDGYIASSAEFVLAGDIDMQDSSLTIENFIGTFNGNGNAIKNFKSESFSLFMNTQDGTTIKNLGLENCKISSSEFNVGGLVSGDWNFLTLDNCYSTGNVKGSSWVGGLIGILNNGTITNSYSEAEVSGQDIVGGLVGFLNIATMENCYSTGDVSGTNEVGGLVGMAEKTITNSYSTGDVTGTRSVGGIVGSSAGTAYTMNITDCFSKGNISGDTNVGGITGASSDRESYINSSACGTVVGNKYVGGIVGYIDSSNIATPTIDSCNVTATIFGDEAVGSIIGGYLSYSKFESVYANYEYNNMTVTVTDCTTTSSLAGVGMAISRVESSFAESHTIAISENLAADNSAINAGVTKVASRNPGSFTLQLGVVNKTLNSELQIQTSIESKLSAIKSIKMENPVALKVIDTFLSEINDKQVEIGAAQNRFESVLDEISIQYENLVSSRSTIKDADMSELSANYIQQQILQQASATLLATANQSPAIALQLI